MNNRHAKIMVIDDEPEVRTPLCDVLSQLGYEVLEYESGEEALKEFRKGEIDLILTDLMMTGMSGIEVIRSALEEDPNIVSIVMTGKGTIQTAVEAMKAGAFDYIMKPLEWKILAPIVSRALEVHRLRENEEKYRSIVEDYQTEMICRFLPDTTLSYVNEAFCRYFNRKREDLIGLDFLSLIPTEDREVIQRFIASFDKSTPMRLHELRVKKPDGTIAWQRWICRAIVNQRGNSVEYQAIGSDITDRKQAEEDLRNSHEQLRALTMRLTAAEESERLRIARELHDQVGQNLTALGINLNMLHNQLSPVMTHDIDSRLNDSMKILEETAKKIRDVMADLRPSVIDDYGLPSAIRWYGEQFAKRTGLSVSLNIDEIAPRLSSEVEIALFRIIQEVLTNVVKHAMATRVSVDLENIDGKVRLSVIDNGVGFEPSRVKKLPESEGWGLINIQERIKFIEGKMTIESVLKKGTRIAIEIRR